MKTICKLYRIYLKQEKVLKPLIIERMGREFYDSHESHNAWLKHVLRSKYFTFEYKVEKLNRGIEQNNEKLKMKGMIDFTQYQLYSYLQKIKMTNPPLAKAIESLLKMSFDKQ